MAIALAMFFAVGFTLPDATSTDRLIATMLLVAAGVFTTISAVYSEFQRRPLNDLFLGGHIHLPYCIEVWTADRRQTGVVLQAGTCMSRRIRNGIQNSYNLVTLQRNGTERRMGIERRDYDPASRRFVTSLRHEAVSLMDRQRTRLNGWRLAPQHDA